MKVVIVGGTHGNEKTGVYLVQKWLKNPMILPTYHEYKLCFGNPQAIAQNQRFIDFDLNRSFNGGNSDTKTYEFKRAQELKAEILDWASGESFFLIDLHTTTTNMGATFVLSKSDVLSAQVIGSVKKTIPSSQILFNKEKDGQCIFVDSMAPHGLIIEMGPVSQNVFDAKLIQLTEKIVLQTLKSLHEAEQKPTKQIELVGFKEAYEVPFPKDRAGAIVHPNLIFKDYQPLFKGQPVFIDPKGQDILWQGENNAYPVFINEAAYLKSQTAFMVCFLHRETITAD